MLSEEEKKAIEKLKETQDSYLKDELDLAIETVLSMLKEKDKQINSKNGTINALQCALKERTEERDRKDDIITKQNKIIDLMAEQLAGLTIWNNEKEEPLILTDKEEVKQYFERKCEE